MRMKQRCSFWTVSSETVAAHRTESPQRRNYPGHGSTSVHSMKTHAVIEAMTRRAMTPESSASHYHAEEHSKTRASLHLPKKKNSIEPLTPSTPNVPLPAVSMNRVLLFETHAFLFPSQNVQPSLVMRRLVFQRAAPRSPIHWFHRR